MPINKESLLTEVRKYLTVIWNRKPTIDEVSIVWDTFNYLEDKGFLNFGAKKVYEEVEERKTRYPLV